MINPVLLGAVLGWLRFPMGERGVIVRVQVTKAFDRKKEETVEEYDLALTTLQLRALGEDLIRAADEHEGRPTRLRRKWWRL